MVLTISNNRHATQMRNVSTWEWYCPIGTIRDERGTALRVGASGWKWHHVVVAIGNKGGTALLTRNCTSSPEGQGLVGKRTCGREEGAGERSC